MLLCEFTGKYKCVTIWMKYQVDITLQCQCFSYWLKEAELSEESNGIKHYRVNGGFLKQSAHVEQK